MEEKKQEKKEEPIRQEPEPQKPNFLPYHPQQTKIPESDMELMAKLLDPVGKASQTKTVVHSDGRLEVVDAQVPFKERITSDLTTAYYSQEDQDLVLELLGIIETQQFIAQQNGLNLGESIDYFTNLIIGLSATTKGKGGFLATLIRTQRMIQEGKQENISRDMSLPQQKKKWGIF